MKFVAAPMCLAATAALCWLGGCNEPLSTADLGAQEDEIERTGEADTRAEIGGGDASMDELGTTTEHDAARVDRDPQVDLETLELERGEIEGGADE